ncbi:MAG: 3-phosphoshikimate 1-carboxyvinyltransferase [Clostridium sp.]
MEKIIIKPKRLSGNVTIPPSKSLGHRGIISASLSKGISKITNVQFSKDIIATIEIMKQLGAKIEINKDELVIDGANIFLNTSEQLQFQCNESGSTLRFLIPISLIKDGEYIFHGKGKLVSRPLTSYYEIFEEKGLQYHTEEGGLPLRISGSLKSGIYRLRGDISSQFITGLLFALPLLKGNSKIEVTTKLESKGYIDLTLEVLKSFGIKIENEAYKVFKVKGSQSYMPGDFRIEGDYSQGAFYLVAGAIGSDIKCEALRKDSLQGDKVIIDILKKMGCKFEETDEFIKSLPSRLKGIDIDVSECPDLVPILGVAASLAEGTTNILNGKRVRIKESDRLFATASELNKIGGRIIELEDGLIIEGIEGFKGGEVDSHNDHRMVMALAIAATRASGDIVINDPMAIEKSYPNFFEDYKKLGGEYE